MIPKGRLDALTDGVFAVAMTLLVIDLKLPEHFQPKDGAELLSRLSELIHPVMVYAISFYVLAMRWTGAVRIVPPGEEMGERYVRWAMLHLLMVTFVPFSTSVVGRFPSLPPAIWLYAANTILFALVVMRMAWLAENNRPGLYFEARLGLAMLIVASLVTIGLSFLVPKWAMFGYFMGMLDTPVRRLLRWRHAVA